VELQTLRWSCGLCGGAVDSAAKSLDSAVELETLRQIYKLCDGSRDSAMDLETLRWIYRLCDESTTPGRNSLKAESTFLGGEPVAGSRETTPSTGRVSTNHTA